MPAVVRLNIERHFNFSLRSAMLTFVREKLSILFEQRRRHFKVPLPPKQISLRD